MANAPRDDNRVTTLLGLSSVDGTTPTTIYVNPTTHGVLTDTTLSGTGLTNAEAVDVADTGLMVLGSDGSNYRTLTVDASGNLQVDVLNTSIAVTGTFWQATQPVSGTVTANLSATDNAVLDTIDSVLDTINAKLVTGTDIGDVTINNSTGAAAVNIQDGGNTITVDGTVAVTGTFWQATQPVSLASVPSHAVTNTGTFVVQENGAALTALQLIDNLAVAVDGNYLNVNANIAGTDIVGGAGAVAAGVQRVTLASNDPAVTSLGVLDDWDSGDTCKVTAQAGTNAIGKLLPPDVDVTTHTNYIRKYYTSAGAATDGIIWSPAAGKRWHVVTMYIQISAAATITLEDDKAGGDDPVFKGEYAANSGVVLQFSEKYPMASGEDAADLTITTTAGNVYVTCVGYEI